MPQVRDLRRISAPPMRFPRCRVRRAAPTVRVRSWFPAVCGNNLTKRISSTMSDRDPKISLKLRHREPFGGARF
jgi:hypothetical protein